MNGLEKLAVSVSAVNPFYKHMKGNPGIIKDWIKYHRFMGKLNPSQYWDPPTTINKLLGLAKGTLVAARKNNPILPRIRLGKFFRKIETHGPEFERYSDKSPVYKLWE